MRYFAMRTLLTIASFFFLTLSLQAQTNQYLSAEDSDPKAVALLEKLEQQLRKELLSIDFEMTVKFPEEDPVVYKGQFVQQGPKYRVSASGMEMWCDGTTRWVYQKDFNEVSLYSAEQGETLGALGILNSFQEGEYIAVVTGSETIRTLPVQVIEMKPVDRESGVSKIRLSVQQDGKPVRVEVFEKNATRTTTEVLRIATPPKQADAYFVFSPARYPGIHIEDLRID